VLKAGNRRTEGQGTEGQGTEGQGTEGRRDRGTRDRGTEGQRDKGQRDKGQRGQFVVHTPRVIVRALQQQNTGEQGLDRVFAFHSGL
jgi:hypothetical protein